MDVASATLQKANRLALAYRDMDDVIRYLAAYSELADLDAHAGNSRYFDHCEAILTAAVVAYCRSFKWSNSEGSADSRLRTDELDCLATGSALKMLHDMLIDRRDGAIAHGDWAHHNTSLLSVEGTAIFRKLAVPRFTQGIDVELFASLAEAVRQEAMARSYSLSSQFPQSDTA